jgi:hypothetical protein
MSRKELILIKTMKNLLLGTILLSTLVLNSCKKDDSKSNTDLLCGKYWKITAATIEPSLPIFNNTDIIGYTNDLYSQWDLCEKDDIQKYNSDKTFVWDTKSKCDVSETQSGNGTWLFNSDETVITEKEDGVSTSYTIVELKDNSLKLSYDFKMGDVTYKISSTMIPE